MENEKTDATGKGDKWLKLNAMTTVILRASAKPAMVALPVLLIVWCAGRLLETLHGNAVFDPASTFWLGGSVGLVLILWVAGLAAKCFTMLKAKPFPKVSAMVWSAFFVLLAVVLWRMDGFQVSVAGLLDAVTGNPESSRNASFLLMKYHPANPMLAVNLGVQAATATEWDRASLAPYVWHWNVLLFLYIWSFAFGILLFLRSGLSFMKPLHLVAAAAGLTALIFLKSKSLVTIEYLMIIQAAVLWLLLFQVLMIYASLRRAAAGPSEVSAPPEAGPFSNTPKAQQTPPFDYRGLPPSAMAIALSFFFVLPILADLAHQVQLASHTMQLVKAMDPASSANEHVRVAVAPLSIRSGPSLGDDVLGVLPKGTRIHVQEARFGWVRMDQNHWVPEKFLRPLVQDEHVSRVGSAKTPS